MDLEKKVMDAIKIIEKRIEYLKNHYATRKEERLNELMNILEELKKSYGI
jgi:prefoldin subunit 5